MRTHVSILPDVFSNPIPAVSYFILLTSYLLSRASFPQNANPGPPLKLRPFHIHLLSIFAAKF
jgi:hypothetical protein